MAQRSKIAQKTTKKTATKTHKPFSYEPTTAKRTIKREASVRGQAEKLLKKGATIAEVERLVAASDKRRKGKPTASVERRARRVVKKMHTSHGYGVTQSASGVIKIFTKK